MEEELINFLKMYHFKYKIYHHEPLFTTEQSNCLRETIEGAHSKNLFLKDKRKSFFLVSVLDYKRVDLKILSKLFGKGGLSFANPEELMEKLHLKPGSVTPYALLHDTAQEISFILDEDFMKYEMVNFHPLRNDMTVSLDAKSFLRYFELINHAPKIIKMPIKID